MDAAAGIESIRGLRLEGDWLCLDPCIPKDWAGFELSVRHGTARYEIHVENLDGVECGVRGASIDGKNVGQTPLRLLLADDGATHILTVQLG